MTYEEKRQARIDRLRARAEAAREHSAVLHSEADKMLSVIPLGQPILIYHYSARRDINYRNRAFGKLDKAYGEYKKAAHYEQRAEAAEQNTAIYSDDPEAIQKLTRQLDHLKARQTDMKRLNAYYRKHKTCVGAEGITEAEALKIDERIRNGYSWNQQPYSSATLSNASAEIRRITGRLEALHRMRDLQPDNPTLIQGDTFRVIQNVEACRVQILFDDKPDDATRALLKQNGFRWAPSEGVWQRLLNPNGLYAARHVADQLTSR